MTTHELKVMHRVAPPDCPECDEGEFPANEYVDKRLVSVIPEHGTPEAFVPTLFVYQCDGCDGVMVAALPVSLYA